MKIFAPFRLVLLFVSLTIIAACVDNDFDEPPRDGEDPGIETNTTIAEILELYAENPFQKLDENIVFDGIVVSDDLTGNIYKSLVVQDETGGIAIQINETNLSNYYGRGRHVYIKASSGLYLGDYNDLPQLGGSFTLDDNGHPTGVEQINATLLPDYIVGGKWNQEITPKEVASTSDLLPTDLNTLVKINNVQFAFDQGVATYAVDSITPTGIHLQESINQGLESCVGGESIVVRNSGYSTFSNISMPRGQGSITGIYQTYRDDRQLTIRDTADVQFTASRCGEATGNETLWTIRELRNYYLEGNTIVPSDVKINGIVISDVANGNITGRNVVIQDNTAGIVIRFDANANYAVGDELDVAISNAGMEEFNGLMQVNGKLDFAKTISLGNTPTVQTVTISEINDNMETYESRLVAIKAALLSGSATYNGNLDVTDATGNIAMYTRSSATFADMPIPTEATDLIAIVSQFNTNQLSLRSIDDVSGGGTGGGDINDINEGFSNATADMPYTSGGWQSITVKGDRIWWGKEFDGNKYVQATAYNSAAAEVETWLVTPMITVDQPKKMSFKSAQAFYNHDGLTVWVSTDFNGTDVDQATWTSLSATIAGSSSADHAWVESGEIDLSAYTSEFYIGFKYLGNPSGQTTSYRIDDVVIENQ